MGMDSQHLEGRADLPPTRPAGSREGTPNYLREADRIGKERSPDEAREEVRSPVSGMLSGTVEIAGWTCHVADGQLHVYEPNYIGDSETITWDTATRVLFLLKLVIVAARANRDQ